MISMVSPSLTGALRSASSPLILPARDALARPEPMEAATSARQAPCSSSLTEPSGRLTLMVLILRSFLPRLGNKPSGTYRESGSGTDRVAVCEDMPRNRHSP